jgi:(p)ppGpp synthase/HD superfamily hydrolase
MPDHAEEPLLTDRFGDALELALRLHRHHLRKSTSVPYFSHLMSVAALVLEDGGSEDEAIAALLHDALEDCADQVSGDVLEQCFGRPVRLLVEACTDTPASHSGGEKPPWKQRKKFYIQHVRTGGATRVSLADKVHNARSILRDQRLIGDAVWDRFSASREDTLWYYQDLVQAYRTAGMTGFLMDEFERVVEEIVARSGPARTGRA